MGGDAAPILRVRDPSGNRRVQRSSTAAWQPEQRHRPGLAPEDASHTFRVGVLLEWAVPSHSASAPTLPLCLQSIPLQRQIDVRLSEGAAQQAAAAEYAERNRQEQLARLKAAQRQARLKLRLYRSRAHAHAPEPGSTAALAAQLFPRATVAAAAQPKRVRPYAIIPGDDHVSTSHFDTLAACRLSAK